MVSQFPIAGPIAAVVCGLAALPAVTQPAMLKSEMLRTWPATEANQGVAVDERFFYAIDNTEIGRYDKQTGMRTGGWKGDPKLFPHINSCVSLIDELVCASSNYPATPMTSTVEIFDRASLTHSRSIPLGHKVGSLTWLVRRNGAWWAGFANYDGRGGEPGRDHKSTALVKFDDAWQIQQQWRFPPTVLDRFKPMSSSGGVWGDDDLLYITGHDNAEVYAMRLPATGDMLELVATIAVPIEGQAIALDPASPRTLYGINRPARQVISVKLPEVAAAK